MNIKQTFAVAKHVCKKYLPEILTGTGLVLGGAAVGTSIVQTRKLQPILDEHENEVAAIKKDELSKDDKKQIRKAHRKMVKKVAKLYALPAALEAGSVALVCGGTRILRKRETAITAAFMAATGAYNEAQKALAKQKALEGPSEAAEGAQTGSEEAGANNPQDALISQYARYFDNTNPNWSEVPEENLVFIRGVLNEVNDMLRSKGHLYLNQVYERLGMPTSLAGQYVGWVIGAGDSCIDFHLFDSNIQQNVDFINGKTNVALLDFNVDGDIQYIYDQMFFGDDYTEKLHGGKDRGKRL